MASGWLFSSRPRSRWLRALAPSRSRYTYMHACRQAYIHMHMHIRAQGGSGLWHRRNHGGRMHRCMHARVHVCMRICTCTCNMRTCTCTCTCTCACTHAYVHAGGRFDHGAADGRGRVGRPAQPSPDGEYACMPICMAEAGSDDQHSRALTVSMHACPYVLACGLGRPCMHKYRLWLWGRAPKSQYTSMTPTSGCV